MGQVIALKLSTIDQPSYEMGVSGFGLLLEEIICRIKNQKFTARIIELETTVIARESSI